MVAHDDIDSPRTGSRAFFPNISVVALSAIVTPYGEYADARTYMPNSYILMLPAQCPMYTCSQRSMIRMLAPDLRRIISSCSRLPSTSGTFLYKIQDPSSERRDLAFTILVHPVVLKLLIRCSSSVRIPSSARTRWRERCSELADRRDEDSGRADVIGELIVFCFEQLDNCLDVLLADGKIVTILRTHTAMCWKVMSALLRNRTR